jgi:hypothetical protein
LFDGNRKIPFCGIAHISTGDELRVVSRHAAGGLDQPTRHYRRRLRRACGHDWDAPWARKSERSFRFEIRPAKRIASAPSLTTDTLYKVSERARG